VQAKGYARRLAPSHDVTVEVFSLYWHFVDVVWIFVFSSLYLAPHFA
jgi:cytochrome c oxidase subunit 3